MCIRDSLKDLQQKHKAIGDVRGRGLMLAIEMVKDRKTKDCLLYTSDAADDLLCVDLGGRRIIKKKIIHIIFKTQTTYKHLDTNNEIIRTSI